MPISIEITEHSNTCNYKYSNKFLEYLNIVYNLIKKAYYKCKDFYTYKNNIIFNNLLSNLQKLENHYQKTKKNILLNEKNIRQELSEREKNHELEINKLLEEYNLITDQLQQFNIIKINTSKILDRLDIKIKHHTIQLNKLTVFQQSLSKELGKVEKCQQQIYDINNTANNVTNKLLENNRHDLDLLEKTYLQKKNLILQDIKLLKIQQK